MRAVGEARRIKTGPDWAAAGLEAGDQILRIQPIINNTTTLVVLRRPDCSSTASGMMCMLGSAAAA